MGAVGTAEIGTIGIAKTGTVGTTKIGAEGMAGMGMVGAGIPAFAAIPSPSKVFANREIGIQMKREQRGMQIHMYEEKETKEGKKK